MVRHKPDDKTPVQFRILEGLNLADTQSSLRLIIGVSRDP